MTGSQPKVLLISPVSDKKDYILPKWFENVLSLSYYNMDILLVDNSKNKSHADTIVKEWGINTIWYDPKDKSAQEFITDSQNILREKFLEGDYDFAFSLECDVLVPHDIVNYFMTYRYPVHNILYFVREYWRRTLCFQICTDYVSAGKKIFRSVLPDFMDGLMLLKGDQVNVSNAKLGRWLQGFAPGIGCTMISRDVLEKIPFRVDAKIQRGAFSDTFFHLDLLQKGIDDIVDTRFLVQHENTGWVANLDYYK